MEVPYQVNAFDQEVGIYPHHDEGNEENRKDNVQETKG